MHGWTTISPITTCGSVRIVRTGGIDCRAQGATYVRLNVQHHRSVRIMRTGRYRCRAKGATYAGLNVQHHRRVRIVRTGNI